MIVWKEEGRGGREGGREGGSREGGGRRRGGKGGLKDVISGGRRMYKCRKQWERRGEGSRKKKRKLIFMQLPVHVGGKTTCSCQYMWVGRLHAG